MKNVPKHKKNESDLHNYMVSRRFDILTPLEEVGYTLPVAFERRDLLLAWAQEHGLASSQIGKINPKNALLIGHELHPFFGHEYHLYYTQIWVSAKYRRYRLALKRDIKDFVDDDGIFRLVDADHVVNKHSAAELDDVWINLLPVWSGRNRGFGWIESRLPILKKGFQAIGLPPLVLFKILRDKRFDGAGENRTKEMTLEDEIDKVIDSLLIHDDKPEIVKRRVSEFRNALRRDVEQAFKKRKCKSRDGQSQSEAPHFL